MDEELSTEEFLDKKRDYSPFLVHLTKDYTDEAVNIFMPAKEVLEQILDDKTLLAVNYKYCYFGPNLESRSSSLQNKFKVVCFTETPLDQIDVLLNKVIGRNFEPKPYGLVFEKKYIREKGGNPVFYVTKEIARPLYDSLYIPLCAEGEEQISEKICKLLALVTICEEWNDWHWEREWRIAGNLEFDLNDIYCGLCPEEDIDHFENVYEPLIFISPYWGINKILDKLVGR